MSAAIIDGKAVAAQLRASLKIEVNQLISAQGIVPGLAVVLVGDDPASEVYVRNKGIATKEAGMNSYEYRLPVDTSEDELLALVQKLNADKNTHGILVQFPVPAQISQQRVIEQIAPEKDVDGLHPLNAGRLASGLPALAPCTPTGCVLLAQRAVRDLTGKHVVIIGRSNLVGKPLAQLFLQCHATVSIAHSRTADLAALACQADILVAAVGIAEMVKGDWVGDGACVIDVGINRIDAPEKGAGKTRLVGDVDFKDVQQKAAFITPVPGGVGPMTIACLLRNTLFAACDQHGLRRPAL